MARAARMNRRLGGFRSRARKLMALCMGGVLLLSGGHAVADYLREGTLRRNLQAEEGGSTQTEPVFSGQVATCTLSPGGGGTRNGDDAATALTLSKGILTATLVCSGENNEAVPKGMKKVCSAGEGQTVAKCKSHEDGTVQVTLESLLGSSRSIEWRKTTQTLEEQNNGEEWTLELQEADLPLSDKAFFVGCDKNEAHQLLSLEGKAAVDCKVDVNVKARPSSVTDNNVVTCAYGKDSNPEPLKVEMTTENNTLTIQCGSEGSLNPESYATQYCDLQGELENCTLKTFEDILPTFAASWWSKGDNSRSATLTIPQTDFPESEQQFRVGCVYKNETSGGPKPAAKGAKTGEAHAAATTSNCNVIVTVRSGSANSSSGQLVATLAGAATMTGLVVGSL
ncbi:SRS domain-containing protein [Neospora caninum Liverpool]|uniref:SRS domain-containing protein n=1 Tax=Neospora caninum (strain Liverpool) TaxID=572307 RepID=F0VM84_NEOCL|nr:SRS domain-containing protein [Neospora caninum Liverpool]CBZ54362.1 SRS domain-containing protein [Neospora caninum Liverpool]CEL69068.1 TPA: SRS domain-containing protein [Neospora caninum Liverpool]|eukprot:XP_003884392.1 SRS domain-containing protein [Neospora caninum Liverpool]